MKHADFVTRLQQRIAAIQSTDVDHNSVAQAAKELDVPETTLRSTLEGCYPRSEDYWRKLRTYCQSPLDWLICGVGQVPEEELQTAERVLIVEKDLDKICLLRMALKGLLVEVAMTDREATLLVSQNTYDMIICGEEVPWSEECLATLTQCRIRPRLVVLTDDQPNLDRPICKLSDHTISNPLSAQGISELVKDQLDCNSDI